MKFTEIETLSKKQKLEVVELWNNEYPKKIGLDSLFEFDQYLNSLSDKNHILFTDDNETVKGWLVYFVRDQEHYFAMLVGSSLQGQGMGSQLLKLAKQYNSELNGWVIDNGEELKQNGGCYKSPIGFYLKNDFEVRSDVLMKKKNISAIKVTWTSTENN